MKGATMNDATSLDSGGNTSGAGGIQEPNKPALSDLNPCLKYHHDINNALLGILGFVELLQMADDPLTDDQRECLDHIRHCAEAITEHSRSLLNLQMNLNQQYIL